MFLTLLALSSCAKELCVASTKDQCPANIEFKLAKDFKASDIEGNVIVKSDVVLYLYADVSSVTIDLSYVKSLVVRGDSASYSGKLTLKFPNVVMSALTNCAVELHDIEAKIKDGIVRADKLIADHVEMVAEAGQQLKVYVDELISDIKSLANSIDVQVVNLNITKFENINANININLAFKFALNTVNIDGSFDLEAHLSRRKLELKSSGSGSVSINSFLVIPTIDFVNLTKKLQVIRDGWLSPFEMFNFNFYLEGGIIVFPPDVWPLTIGFFNFFDNRMKIIVDKSSKIEIGCQNLPADIINNVENTALEIVALAKRCGITGKIILGNATIDIKTSLNEVVQFTADTIESALDQAKVIGDNMVQLVLHVHDKLNILRDKIKTYFEEFKVKAEEIITDGLNLAAGASLIFDLDINNNNIVSGNLTVNGEISASPDGSKFSLDINLEHLELSLVPYQKLKELISKPMNLMCSKKEFKHSDWLLDVVGDLNEDVESFKRVAQLNYAKTGDLYCLQLQLKELPDVVSESYCIGTNCPSNSEVITLDKLKDYVDKGTKRVEIELKEAINNFIDLSQVQASANYTFTGNVDHPELKLDLDVATKNHVLALDITSTNLNFNLKNSHGDYVKIDIPFFSLKDTKLTGDWKDKEIDFTGSQVAIGIDNFKDMAKAKYQDLTLRLTDSINSFKIGADKWVAEKLLAIQNIEIPKSQISGALEVDFNADFLSSLFNFKVDIDAALSSIDGLTLNVHSSASKSLSIELSDRWNQIQSSGTGLKIKYDRSVTIKGVTDKAGLSFEGTGDVTLELKVGQTTFKLDKSMKISSDTTFRISNGDAAFAELNFEGESSFRFESTRASGSKMLLAPAEQQVIVETMSCSKDSKVELADVKVNNKLIMQPGATLSADNIDVSGKEVVINYLLDKFPAINANEEITKPSKIIFNYASEDVSTKSQLIGSAFPVLCGESTKFTEGQCNEYAKTSSFSSQFVDLNGDSSVVKTFCASIPLNEQANTYKQCLMANITAVPSSERVESGKKKANVGLIVGCTIAAIVVVAVIVVVVVKIVKKNNNDMKKMSSSD